MIAVANFKDLSDLLGDGYSSPGNYFGEERYLFLVEFDRHPFAPPLVRVRTSINVSNLSFGAYSARLPMPTVQALAEETRDEELGQILTAVATHVTSLREP
jgi:hypothetical protein